VESLRKFKLDPSRGVKENEELIPPPTFSDKTVPINWGYHQNSTIKVTTDQTTGKTILTNQSRAPKINTYYIPFDTPTVPSAPPPLPLPDPILQSLLTELHAVLAERPIWTRRAILNRISRSNPGIYLLKPAIQYIGYQFRGGPWRDAIVRYGIDPRSSPEYRIYQTLFFKIVDHEPAASAAGKPWHDKRSEYTRKAHPETLDPNSHIFDGTSISLDGKIWQVCDITDPLLVRLLSTPTLREKCDLHSDGWFCNGTWAKVRAIMRTKISAIRIGREMLDSDFAQTLQLPDVVKNKTRVTAYTPNLGLQNTVEDDADTEVEDLVEGTGVLGAVGSTGRAWRRRKIKGIKKRNRKGLDGAVGTMLGFGKAVCRVDGRNLGRGKGKGKGNARGDGLGPGSEGLVAWGESVALGGGGNVRARLAAIDVDSLDGVAENEVDNGHFSGGGEESENDDEENERGDDQDDEENEESDEGDGAPEDEEENDEDDDEEHDDDDDDDDEELDGEGW